MSERQSFCHILVIEDTKSKRIVLLKEQIYSLGRASCNTIVLNDPLASRRHATLIRDEQSSLAEISFRIVDGDLQGNASTNGLLVNGKHCSSHRLQHGDSIIFSSNSQATYHIARDRSYLQTLTNSNYHQTEPVKQTIYANNERQQTVFSVEPDEQKLSAEKLSKLASFPELSPYPIIEINLTGEITYLNSATLLQFKDISERKLEHPILAELLTKYKNAVNSDENLFIREVKIAEKVFEQHIHYLPESRGIRSYIFDVSDRKLIEKALLESEERYRAIIRQTSEGIFLIDADSKTLVEANPYYCNLLGYNSTEIIGLKLENLVVINNQLIAHSLAEILSKKIDFLGESLHRRKDGSLVEVEVSVSLISYRSKEMFCFFARDITERKKTETLLQYQAFHDLLTGLPNRNFFNRELAVALANAKAENRQLAVMFLDLDRFKNINDSLGHAFGDRILQLFSQRLQSCLREGDIVARWGGDEFTILLSSTESTEEAASISDRIFQILKYPFELEEQQIFVKSSIGIAVYPQDGENGETLLRNADAALYRSKEQGRNLYRFYRSTMNSEASALLKLENYLHRALEKEELLVHYQPQVNIITGKISGMEALLRWQHPELGLVSPGKFIPLAEETGLIIPLGEWVLKTACIQNKAWQIAGIAPLKISVNLSPRQFEQSNLVTKVEQILQETGLEAQWLELEVTETSLLQNVKFANLALEKLVNMGVHISIDDFGTGYSSLGYLKKFPFHTLKIDQLFVRELKNKAQDLAIISAIITLGQGFNLRVIAEGVEKKEQLELLRSLNCEEIQGYWFSPPLSSEKATEFLQKENYDNFM
jgi:diguanylate cyclase (GGDEF)-like protein/PAS domain S-box-containing protein